MQIVINIDDEIAQGIIEGYDDEPRNIVRSFQATIADAIKNGIPLPKGHGRLGDLDKLAKDCESSEYHEVITAWLDLAPTIIEKE